MANQKKRRRKSAGPPPTPRKAQERVEERRKEVPAKKGGPREPSFQGVMIRAGLVAVLFYPYLLFIAGESSQTSFLVSAIAFVAMIPLGLLLDRWRYRLQMRRYERQQGGK